METYKKTLKKIFAIAGRVIQIAIIVLAVFMVVFTVMSLTVLDEAERNFFGFKAYAVLSGSMSETDFDAGDIVVVRTIDPSKLKAGDIVSYISVDEENDGEIITHKIRTLVTDIDGNPGFITYGTTTDTDDETIVTYDMIVGKYVFKIPNVGSFLEFLREPAGYMIFIFLPLAVIIVMQAINSLKIYRTIQSGDSEDTKEYKEQRQTQQEQNLLIQKELEALRAELEQINQHNNSSKEE